MSPTQQGCRFVMKIRWQALVGDLLILFTCILIVMLFVANRPATGIGSYLEVKSPHATFRYTLDKDAHFFVPGLLGDTEIEIVGGKVQVLSDPGPHKISVNHKPISSGSEWIASLPNQILLTIISDNQEEIDDASF